MPRWSLLGIPGNADNLVNDAGIRKLVPSQYSFHSSNHVLPDAYRRCVAQLIFVACQNLAKNTPHNLPTACFG